MKIVLTLILFTICSHLYTFNTHFDLASSRHLNDFFKTDTMKLKLIVGSKVFSASLLNNAAITAFKAKLPLTIKMKELNGNEKYGDLEGRMPSNPSNPGNILTGDLMLYGSNTIVVFYKTFPTSYSYTQLGHIDNPAGLADELGTEDVNIRFELH